MVPSGQFSKDLTVFEQHRQEWSRSHPGEFVVIQEGVIAEGFFGTYADALSGLRHGLPDLSPPHCSSSSPWPPSGPPAVGCPTTRGTSSISTSTWRLH